NNLLTVPQLYKNIKKEKIDGFLQLTQHQDEHSLAFATPLLYILPDHVTKTIVPKHPHGKTNAIAKWLLYLKENEMYNIEIFLTNKDRRQITAINQIWTNAK
ncbi:26496_t:CDS:2, partial [Racocetra persica]